MGGFAEYYGQTLMHPLALTFTVILGLAALWTPRRYALVPILLAATTLPMAQRVVIAGADFTLLRLLLLAYVIRILFRREWVGFAWNRLDSAVLIWVVVGATMVTVQYGFDMVVNRAGWAYDILLTYFASRILIRHWYDFLTLAKATAIISVPMAAIFLYELATQKNMFHVFGGVSEFTWVREGRLRCQGPFAHPIIAGTFWAALMPLIWMLWRGEGQSRFFAIIGTLAGVTIIASTASSTPLLSSLAAVMGLSLFFLRGHRTKLWVGLFAAILILHFFIMKQPVWHLMARLDVVGGSTGWHRFVIFDAFVRHFSDWWLIGYATPTDWAWQMRDITNQYIGQGINGGLSRLVAFIMVLVVAFANVGRALGQGAEADRSDRVSAEWHTWLVGVIAFVHVVTFWGLAYFGQMSTLFYLQLAFAGSVVGLAEQTEERAGAYREKVREPSVLRMKNGGRSTAVPLNSTR